MYVVENKWIVDFKPQDIREFSAIIDFYEIMSWSYNEVSKEYDVPNEMEKSFNLFRKGDGCSHFTFVENGYHHTDDIEEFYLSIKVASHICDVLMEQENQKKENPYVRHNPWLFDPTAYPLVELPSTTKPMIIQ